MKSYLFAFLLFLMCLTSFAQRCAQLSMESIGGNKTELVSNRVISHSDGTFSLYIQSESTTGNINTTCPGTFSGGGSGSFFYRRYNPLGTTMQGESCTPFTSSFSQEYWYPLSNGDTIFFGNKELPGRSHDIAVERRNASGAVLWTKYYGGTSGEAVSNVLALEDGGFLILTASRSTDGDVGLHYGGDFDTDIWIFKIDANGTLLWSKVLGGSGADLPRDLKAPSNGGCYIFGVTASSDHDATGMKGESDLYVVKLDNLGQKEWHRCLGGTAADGSGYDPEGIKALEDGLGGFYIMNRTHSHDGDVQRRVPVDDGADFWLVHIDSLANILWESTFGGPGWQIPKAFCRATDGNFWIGGQTPAVVGGMIDAAYGMTDSWVVHADSLGNFINQRSFGNNKEDQIDMLYPLSDGTVLAGGRYNSTVIPGPTSPGFPQSTEGEHDIFLTQLGPETVGLKDKILEPSVWELFPNPAGKVVSILVNNRYKYKITIADASGSIKYKNTFWNKQELNTSGWQAGVYTVTLTDNSGRTGTKKMVITNP